MLGHVTIRHLTRGIKQGEGLPGVFGQPPGDDCLDDASLHQGLVKQLVGDLTEGDGPGYTADSLAF